MPNNTDAMTRPRRSCLYMPGSNRRALEKARTLPADVIIMDLEDAVAPELKAQAREQVVSALTDGGFGQREVMVRINGIHSDWGLLDLDAILAAQPDAIVLPKAETEADIRCVSQRILDAHLPGDMTVWAMIETPMALMNIGQIAAAAKTSRLRGLIVGSNDLIKDLRIASRRDRQTLLPALISVVTAARAYGLEAIDGVYNDIADEVGLRAECEQGRDLGFDGKTVIHPSQLAICNELFRPDADSIDWAYKVRAAFDLPEHQTAGVIKLDGHMVERLHLEQAERLITLHEAIQAHS